MTSGSVRFEDFVLEPENRRLSRAGVPVDLNARYLDALALMVADPGTLVTKDRFMAEVWRGVPVTDEALTQCIRTLRRLLGDDAARPRFIETVPKHGYRFIAPVDGAARGAVAPATSSTDSTRRQFAVIGTAGVVGGVIAGLIGGLIYGITGTSQPLAPGMGAISILLVLLCLCVIAALIGAVGVGFGAAAAVFAPDRGPHWSIGGGAAGGMLVGATAKLLGLDAFTLLVGRSPGDITGGAEGAMIGAAVGLAVWLGARRPASPLRRHVITAGAIGAAAGLVVTALGGELMAGSLELLSHAYPDSQLGFDRLGLFGEPGLGVTGRLVTGALEGGLFTACVVGAMLMARRALSRPA